MKNCLVIIDVQKGFLYDKTNHVPNKIKELLEREKFDFIVATQYVNNINTSCYKFLDWKFLMDEESQRLDSYIDSVKYRSFIKNTYSCFTKEFEQFLKENEIGKLAFCGIDTDCCVLASVLDAFDKGYEYEVYKECCASCGGKESHDAAFKVMERTIGKQYIK